MRVTINGGHAPNGQPDPGAVGATGLQEAIVSDKVGRLVADYLSKVGYDINYIQHDSLQEICNSSNNFDSDVFVSIHCNSATNPAATGTETFSYYNSSQGPKLANAIQQSIIEKMGTVDRGIKTAGYYVLRNTDAVSVLIEMEFISNPQGESMLRDESMQDSFARAIAVGVTNYFSSL